MRQGGGALVTKLKSALKAIQEAPASIQRRPEIRELKSALNLAIQELGTAPGPSPSPSD